MMLRLRFFASGKTQFTGGNASSPPAFSLVVPEFCDFRFYFVSGTDNTFELRFEILASLQLAL